MIQRIPIFYLIALSGVFIITEEAVSQHAPGARAVAAGQTSVSVPNNAWAVFSNISLLKTNQRQLSFYGFRYSGIAEITDAVAAATIPVGAGAIGAGVHRYGFSLFSETSFRAGYAHGWQNLRVGAVVSYTNVQQGGGYGSAGAFGIDLGAGGKIVNPLWFGVRATNINQPAYSGSIEELPRELAAGITYVPSPNVMVSAETVKDVRFPISLRAGADIELVHGLRARAGVSTNPQTYSGGFGYSTDRWQINFAVQQHIPLGLSPAIDVGISL